MGLDHPGSSSIRLCHRLVFAMGLVPKGTIGGRRMPKVWSWDLCRSSPQWYAARGQKWFGALLAAITVRTRFFMMLISASALLFPWASSPAEVVCQMPRALVHSCSCLDTNSLALSVCNLTSGRFKAESLAWITANPLMISVACLVFIGITKVKCFTSKSWRSFTVSIHFWLAASAMLIVTSSNGSSCWWGFSSMGSGVSSGHSEDFTQQRSDWHADPSPKWSIGTPDSPLSWFGFSPLSSSFFPQHAAKPSARGRPFFTGMVNVPTMKYLKDPCSWNDPGLNGPAMSTLSA